MQATPLFTDKLVRAVVSVVGIHNTTELLPGEIPCPKMAHLLGAASLVLEAGGTETEAIAALAHTTITDAYSSPQALIAFFGEEVTSIIMEVTPDPNLNLNLELAYAQAVFGMSNAALLVSLAGKLWLLRHYKSERRLFTKETERFYRMLVTAYNQRSKNMTIGQTRLFEELRSLLVNLAPTK